MNDYFTLESEACAELTERRSRFIATAAPVKDAAEAEALISRVKAQYSDATHNVWAYLIDSGNMRASDDGEPSGTAGAPVLEVLKKNEIVKAAVVVTRYFGGVLLGAGGLIRAYGAAAALGVNAARIITMAACEKFSITADYADGGRIKNALERSEAVILSSSFGEKVSFECYIAAEKAADLRAKITDLTAARAQISSPESGYYKVK